VTLNPNQKLLNTNQLSLSISYLSHDHLNQLCSTEGKIAPAHPLPHKAHEAVPNARNIDKSVSDIRMRIRFTFESSFWISVSEMIMMPEWTSARVCIVARTGVNILGLSRSRSRSQNQH